MTHPDRTVEEQAIKRLRDLHEALCLEHCQRSEAHKALKLHEDGCCSLDEDISTITIALTTTAQQSAARTWEEAARFAEARMTAGGAPEDEYEQGMHAEARIQRDEYLHRRATTGGTG